MELSVLRIRLYAGNSVININDVYEKICMERTSTETRSKVGKETGGVDKL